MRPPGPAIGAGRGGGTCRRSAGDLAHRKGPDPDQCDISRSIRCLSYEKLTPTFYNSDPKARAAACRRNVWN